MNDLRVGGFSFSEIFEVSGYKPPAMLRTSTVHVQSSQRSDRPEKKVDEAAQKALESAKVIGQTDPAPLYIEQESPKIHSPKAPFSEQIVRLETQPVFPMTDMAPEDTSEMDERMKQLQKTLEEEGRLFAFDDELEACFGQK